MAQSCLQISQTALRWGRATVTVDGTAVEFRVLEADDTWVAEAVLDEVVIGIEARGWPFAESALVTVTDFEPYVAGIRELRNRQPW